MHQKRLELLRREAPGFESGVSTNSTIDAIKVQAPQPVLYNDNFLCRTFRLFSGNVPPYYINNKVYGLLYTHHDNFTDNCQLYKSKLFSIIMLLNE